MSNYYSNSNNSGIPKSSPGFLRWVKGLSTSSRTQQERVAQTQTYKFDTTQNRILVDVVIVQQVVEYELTSYRKQKSVRNYIMGALLPANEMPVLEEIVRDCNNNNNNNNNNNDGGNNGGNNNNNL